MKLLILGGTRFLGRHLVTAALARDDQVTLFNRGRHSSEGLTQVESIHGDRHSDLTKLEGRQWDAVVDTCGTLPRAVQAAAEVLSNSVDRYVFISTQNVYASVSSPGVDETSPLKTLNSEQLDRANAIDTSGDPSYAEMYGGLKALCERAAEEAMPGRVLTIRPGLIVGPNDYTDRFTYWIARVAAGGEVLAPGPPERYVQFIDVRDMADWIVKMVERKETGIYNANGPTESLTMRTVMDESKSVSGSNASFTWVSEHFLLRENVAPWSEMPFWLPEQAAPHLKGFMFINCDKATAAGLTFRRLRDTVSDTLTWYRTIRAGEKLQAGIDAEKEQGLLRKWHERN